MLPAFPNGPTNPPIQYPVQALPAAPAATFVYLPPDVHPANGTPAIAGAVPIYPFLSADIAPPTPVVDAFVVPRSSVSSAQAVPADGHRSSNDTQAVPGGTPLPRKSVGKHEEEEEKGDNVDPNFAPCRLVRWSLHNNTYVHEPRILFFNLAYPCMAVCRESGLSEAEAHDRKYCTKRPRVAKKMQKLPKKRKIYFLLNLHGRST
jgi:hypothetical protein